MLTRTITGILACATMVSMAMAQQTVQVPGLPYEESLYQSKIYREEGTDHVLSLFLSTPNIPDTLEGSRTYKLWYRVSNDGGNTYHEVRQLILKGDEFDALRPIRGIDLRKVGFVTSHAGPVRGSNGEIMVPIELWRMDEQGEVYNPAHPYTYCDSAVLIARWTEDFRDVEWDMGDRVQLSLEQSTAGGYEPALAELSEPGRFVFVLRGSNTGKPSMPSYKWIAVSDDYCRTWSEPAPLTYTDGEKFFSPSACSEFLRHSNGKLYWIGNIIPDNANGNHPRYPLNIAEFDEETLGLKKDTVQVLFTRDPEKDSPQVQFSNFRVIEDPSTGKIVVTLSRFDVNRIPDDFQVPAGMKSTRANAYRFPTSTAVVEVR